MNLRVPKGKLAEHIAREYAIRTDKPPGYLIGTTDHRGVQQDFRVTHRISHGTDVKRA